MIELSPEASRHIAAIRKHYLSRERPEALRNLAIALSEASATIERDPAAGLSAPRPYPQLAKAQRLWLHVRRYWIAYSMTPLRIVAVFYDAANIPKRL